MSRRRSDRPGARPGRPPESDRRAVRDELLEAACRLFSRHGYSAVSLRSLAGEAGVTPAMVHYYFGDKHGLYMAILESTVGEALADLESADADFSGGDALGAFMDRYIGMLAANPWLAPLIYREVLLSEGKLPADFIERFPARVRRLLRGALEVAVRRGEIRRDLDLDLLLISLIGSCVFPFLARPMIEQGLGMPLDERFTDRWRQHARRLFLDGARP
jgi:AcrR family transcriptional regulator